jgi:Terminase large subunit, ATPase domain
VLDNGKPMRLEAFQRTVLADYFAGATETVVIMPKKNGKTTLLSALALYHLTKTEDAECVIAASSRDQAKILFNQAAKMVKASGLDGVRNVDKRIFGSQVGRALIDLPTPGSEFGMDSLRSILAGIESGAVRPSTSTSPRAAPTTSSRATSSESWSRSTP